tara:strand:+ start:781 stop:1155 length:375 start_codon:yes stop_codon:yes gene_type:complete
MSTLKDQDWRISNRLAMGLDANVISVEEWKRRKIIWQEVTSRPNCKNCGKKLSAHFDEVLVQRFEPEEIIHEDFVEKISNSGIRSKTDYSQFQGFGHRNKGIFCTGRCCESFAYKVCDQFEGVA